MPEGPEVKVVTDQLQGFLNKEIKSHCIDPHSRYRNAKCGISDIGTGESFNKIYCKGKTIVFEVGEKRFINRLAMTGYWSLKPSNNNVFEIEFEDGSRLSFNDDRHFGVFERVTPFQLELKLKKMGLDLLNDTSVTLMQFYDRLEKCSKHWQLAQCLMDQEKVTCGVGNYIKSEVCYKIGVDPRSLIGKLIKNQDLIQELYHCIHDVMWDAYKANGNTIQDFQLIDGKPGGYQHQLQVYSRDVDSFGNTISRIFTKDKRTSWVVESIQEKYV